MVMNNLFASPRIVNDISECYFYHVMDLPGYGEVGEEWDLRGGEEAYLGGVSLQGKRVLELGTASGYLCRYMESRGADVIGFDLPSERSWDLVPFARADIATYGVAIKNDIERLKNGWWFTHRLFGSKARVVYGNIYDIPEAIGPLDVATFGAILLHLRDPFQALYSALRLTREMAIVTEVHPEQPPGSPMGSTSPPESPSRKRRFLSNPHQGQMFFVPAPGTTDPSAAVTWWSFPPQVICQFLGVLGFEDQVVTEHSQCFMGKRARLYTVVGRRTVSAR
jgi:hypothetical protein